MLSLNANTKIFFSVTPADMRKGFNGLQGLVIGTLQQDPLSGHLFLFLNRRKDRLKIIYWDGDGLAIWYKRLESGTFELPKVSRDETHVVMTHKQLTMFLGGFNWQAAKARKRFSLDPN